MDEEKTQSPQESPEGKEEKTTAEKIANLNAETESLNKAIAENENAKAKAMLGGTADAGQPKPTAEEERKAEAQKAADEIVNAFN